MGRKHGQGNDNLIKGGKTDAPFSSNLQFCLVLANHVIVGFLYLHFYVQLVTRYPEALLHLKGTRLTVPVAGTGSRLDTCVDELMDRCTMLVVVG